MKMQLKLTLTLCWAINSFAMIPNKIDSFGETPLFNRNDVLVETLSRLNNKQYLNAPLWVAPLLTPLGLYIQVDGKESYELVKILLEAGADPNLKNPNGYYPIQLTHTKNKIKLLIEYGANVNSQDSSGQTALLEYVEYKEIDIEIIKMLLASKADPNIQDFQGFTALIKVVIKIDMNLETKKEWIKLLIDYGADPFIKDNNSKSALDYAKENNQQELVNRMIGYFLVSQLAKVAPKFVELRKALSNFKRNNLRLPTEITDKILSYGVSK